MIKTSNILTNMAVDYAKNPAKFNTKAYCLAWSASSIGQVTVIYKNKTISKHEKKFLIPQEVLNGVLNVSFFFIFANLASKITETIISTKNLKQNKFTAGISAIASILGGIIASDILTPIIRNKIAAKLQNNKKIDYLG